MKKKIIPMKIKPDRITPIAIENTLSIGDISLSSPLMSCSEMASLIIGMLQSNEIKEYLNLIAKNKLLKEVGYIA